MRGAQESPSLEAVSSGGHWGQKPQEGAGSGSWGQGEGAAWFPGLFLIQVERGRHKLEMWGRNPRAGHGADREEG